MFYFVIPTINGEINGKPIILRHVHKIEDVIIPYECTVYLINYFNGTVTELDI